MERRKYAIERRLFRGTFALLLIVGLVFLLSQTARGETKECSTEKGIDPSLVRISSDDGTHYTAVAYTTGNLVGPRGDNVIVIIRKEEGSNDDCGNLLVKRFSAYATNGKVGTPRLIFDSRHKKLILILTAFWQQTGGNSIALLAIDTSDNDPNKWYWITKPWKTFYDATSDTFVYIPDAVIDRKNEIAYIVAETVSDSGKHHVHFFKVSVSGKGRLIYHTDLGEGYRPSLGVEESGFVVVAYGKPTKGICVRVSSNGGQSFGSEFEVNNPENIIYDGRVQVSQIFRYNDSHYYLLAFEARRSASDREGSYMLWCKHNTPTSSPYCQPPKDQHFFYGIRPTLFSSQKEVGDRSSGYANFWLYYPYGEPSFIEIKYFVKSTQADNLDIDDQSIREEVNTDITNSGDFHRLAWQGKDGKIYVLHPFTVSTPPPSNPPKTPGYLKFNNCGGSAGHWYDCDGIFNIEWGKSEGADKYELYRGDTLIHRDSSTSFTDTVTKGKEYTYKVRACNNAGKCSGFVSANIDVHSELSKPIWYTKDFEVESTEDYTISWSKVKYASKYYLCENEDCSIETSSTSLTISRKGVKNPTTYTYTVSAYDDKCRRYSDFSDALKVTVHPPPNNPPEIEEFDASPSSGEAPVEVTFTCQAYDHENDPLTYKWVYGDGSSGETINNNQTTHTYKEGDANGKVYMAKVQVCDNKGACSDWEEREITVYKKESGGDSGDNRRKCQKYSNDIYQAVAAVYSIYSLQKISNKETVTIDDIYAIQEELWRDIIDMLKPGVNECTFLPSVLKESCELKKFFEKTADFTNKWLNVAKNIDDNMWSYYCLSTWNYSACSDFWDAWAYQDGQSLEEDKGWLGKLLRLGYYLGKFADGDSSFQKEIESLAKEIYDYDQTQYQSTGEENVSAPNAPSSFTGCKVILYLGGGSGGPECHSPTKEARELSKKASNYLNTAINDIKDLAKKGISSGDLSGQIIGKPIPSKPTIAEVSPKVAWLSMGPDAADNVLTPGEMMDLLVNFPDYQGAVDVYAAIWVPPQWLLFINTDNQFVLFDGSFPPFRTNVTDNFHLTFFEDLPISNPLTGACSLPSGYYGVYMIVVPGGLDLNTIDWSTDPYLFEYYIVEVKCSP